MAAGGQQLWFLTYRLTYGIPFYHFASLTGLLAAFVDDGTDSLQVALAHLFFNVFGISNVWVSPFATAKH